MTQRWRIPNSKPWITYSDVEDVAYVMGNIMTGEHEIGSEVAAFEHELAEFLSRKYVVCVSSGTVALELAVSTLKHKGGPYAVPAFGFIATANAAARAGRKPRFVDEPCDPILGEVSDELWRGPGLVRDAAQGFGSRLPDAKADCYSFNWNKPITCLGGGCVATDDQMLDSTVRVLRDQGRAPIKGDPLQAYMPGTNARMSDMQAALGRSQLRRVGEILERRRMVWGWYEIELNEIDLLRWGKRPESPFLYPIELSNRDEVHAKMLERGIQTRSCADWLLPAHPYYTEKYGYKRGDFPEAERRADRTLLLPLYPEMTLEDVKAVCLALEECDARS